MPIYAYRCKKCGAEEEHIQRMSDPPIAKCESCGGRLTRLVSAAAFHLKGGGWYRDGYASTKPGGGDGGGESKSSDGGGGESKSETKKDKGTDKGTDKKAKKGGDASASLGGGASKVAKRAS
jgi:putative FmdB family regulatory protein